jgi:ABC-2 type transport system ATP-binding protein
MVRFSEVTKEYRAPPWRAAEGRVRALDGVTLELPPGSALGLVGPNGAGKSTLLRILLGYLRPTSGEVEVGGLPPREYAETRGIGYVPESVALPPRWTVRGALEAFAALGEVPDPEARIERVVATLGLEGLERRRVRALSKGNKQKLALAQALLPDRRLLVLDEPLNGLDPVWVARMRGILAEWRAADPERALLLVSHNLAELERTVDRAAVLVDGKVRAVLELGTPGAPSLEARFLEVLGEEAG